MTLRTTVLWTLFVFAAGWTAGRWSATEPSVVGAALPPSAPSVMRADGQTALASGAPAASAPTPVVAARDTAIETATAIAAVSGAQSPATSPLNSQVMDALLKMHERNQQMSAIDFPAQMRSEPWATESEAKIRAALEPKLEMIAGARVQRADCRATLCQTEVIVPEWAKELLSLEDGGNGLRDALDGAKLGVETIHETGYFERGMKRLLFTMRPADRLVPPPAPGQ